MEVTLWTVGTMMAPFSILFSIPVSITIFISVFCPVPIFTFGSLPTEDRARVVLDGDQRLNRAKARINNVAPAPVLDDSIWMIFLVICILGLIISLSVSLQGKKADEAKSRDYESDRGWLVSHVGSPI
jgi:hypothetical protein